MAGIKRALRAAIAGASNEIAALADPQSHYARGLCTEGYMGGYYAALCDVELALNGVEPERWQTWRELSAERVGKAPQNPDQNQ